MEAGFESSPKGAERPMSEAEQAGAPSKEPKIIKRYTNRKLYDTVESRYVTLDEIAAMIKEGVEVQIVDNRTKEDLTSVTLAQIVFEEEKKKSQMPLGLLREIIRRPGDKLLRRDGEQAEVPAPPPAPEPAKEPKEGLLKTAQRGLEDFQKQIDERVN